MKPVLFIIIIPVLLFAACKKNSNEAAYKGEARILLFGDPNQGAQGDSVFYVFANYPQSQTEKQINIKVQLVGNTSPDDRQFSLIVDKARSTALPSEYHLPESLVLPANAYEAIVPVTIYRTARLKNDTARLVLKAMSTADLKVDPVKPGNLGEMVEFKIIWLDKLVQSDDWAFHIWGNYSRAKHQLIIDVTGIADFSELTVDDLYSIASQCNAYIEKYNEEHPGNPLKDENGNIIRYCPTCP